MNVSCVCVCPHSPVCERAVLIDPRRFVRQKIRKKQNKKSCHRFLSLISLSHVLQGLLLHFGLDAVGVLSLREHAPALPPHPPTTTTKKQKKSIRFLSFLSSIHQKIFLSLNLGLHIIIILVSTPHPSPFVPCQKEEE